jgi:hypothetical protein
MKRRCRFLLLALLVLPFARQAPGQAVLVDVEAGYRFLDVSGNEDLYRSQINERKGFLLHNLNVSATGGVGAGLFDHVRLDATDIGAGPAGALRFEAGRAGAYRFQFAFRHAQLFSALPAFANPLLSNGIVPGQHTQDRTRDTFDATLEFLPGGMFSPFVGYSRNHLTGPGRTTYHVGQDEFRLDSDLDDTEQEIRIGTGFRLGPVAGEFSQGWRQYKGSERLSLAAGGNDGNNAGTVLGVPVSLQEFSRETTGKVNTPVTQAFAAAELTPGLRLSGSYSRAKSGSDGAESESLEGNLVSFAISRFFAGLDETISQRSDSTQWRVNGRVDYQLAPGVDATASFTQKHREFDGFGLISTLFFDTENFSHFDPRNFQELISASNALERTEKIYDVIVSAHILGPIAIRAGWTLTDQGVNASPAAAEIVVPGGQGGAYVRRIQSFLLGATVAEKTVTFGAEFRNDDANDPIFRTDYLNRKRYKLRGSIRPGDFLTIAANADQTNFSNDREGIGFTGRSRNYGLDLDVSFWKPLRLRVSGGRFLNDTKIPIRQPQDFSVVNSLYAENGRFEEGGLAFSLAPVTFDASIGTFRNSGSYPFRVHRAHARVEYAFASNFSGIGEWAKDKYEEASPVSGAGKYNANRYGVFLRWRQ